MISSSSPTSNDLLFRLQSKQLNYTVIAQSAEEVQNILNSPAVSMGPYRTLGFLDYDGRIRVHKSLLRPNRCNVQRQSLSRLQTRQAGLEKIMTT